jgi:aromatic ring-opening dioxygenase LigB subunit
MPVNAVQVISPHGTTLSEAVAEVMQQQPEQVLETATIINAIFTNDISKASLTS